MVTDSFCFLTTELSSLFQYNNASFEVGGFCRSNFPQRKQENILPSSIAAWDCLRLTCFLACRHTYPQGPDSTELPLESHHYRLFTSLTTLFSHTQNKAWQQRFTSLAGLSSSIVATMTTYIPALTIPHGVFANPAASILLPIGLGTAVGYSTRRKYTPCTAC